MLNILIPIAGTSNFFNESDYKYPKPLVEIRGKPMIEWVIGNLSSIQDEKHFIFIVSKKDCEKFHIDNVLHLLTNNNCTIIKINGHTKGAACSSLLAMEYINNSDSLIISNGDQVIDIDFNLVLNEFKEKSVDAGVICFNSVHPKWSYVRLDETENIIETAEKRPLSRHAIAGFYYYKKGSDFIRSTMSSIKKDASVDGAYFVAPTLNELVLEGKKMKTFNINSDQYHNFYSPQRINEFESKK